MTFAVFYGLYPRKMARKDAEKAWKSMTTDEQEKALEALPQHLKYWKIKETAKDYIPYPASWLRAGRYEDELDIEPIQNKKPELPFYATEELTLKKAQEVGITPYAGEGWQQLRARISQRIKQLEEQL
jgi:hypothetical protein